MGRMIHSSAAADKILRDVTITLAVAEATGADMHADAQGYLSDALAQSAEIDTLLEENSTLLVRYRAQLQAGNERSNDVIQQVRDEFFNLIGRGSRDPTFKRIFAGGGGPYAAFTPRQKAVALELLASAIETHRHRRVSDEDVARLTGLLRDEAATMTEILAVLLPAIVEGRVLQAQRTAAAQMAHQRLTALKRFWLGEGLSEAEIHEVIPSRPTKRKAADEAELDLDETEDLDDVDDGTMGHEIEDEDATDFDYEDVLDEAAAK